MPLAERQTAATPCGSAHCATFQRRQKHLLLLIVSRNCDLVWLPANEAEKSCRYLNPAVMHNNSENIVANDKISEMNIRCRWRNARRRRLPAGRLIALASSQRGLKEPPIL